MGKKVANELNVNSPTKNLSSIEVKFEDGNIDGLENDSRRDNMDHPHSNNNKKTSKVEGNSGSGRTQDNPQVEEERMETVVQGFDIGAQEEENNGQPDDNKSRVSKKDSQYLKFYKFYYKTNKQEHPNWTPSQITYIVSLLWKKKKSHEKNTPSKPVSRMTSRRSNKALTAKQAFKLKHKDLKREEIDSMWSKLPHESKNFWKKEGDNYCTTEGKLSEVSSVKNCKAPLPVHNFMKTLLNSM